MMVLGSCLPAMLIESMMILAVKAESSTSSSAQEYKPVGPTEYRVLQAQGNGQSRSFPAVLAVQVLHRQCQRCLHLYHQALLLWHRLPAS